MNNEFISINVKCPKCGKSLMDPTHKVDSKSGIKLSARSLKNSGSIWLSSLYGSYKIDADIEIEKDEIVVLSCPYCRSEIISQEFCEACRAPMSSLILDMGGKVNFCTRKGCSKHSMEFEDMSLALKNFYEQFDLYSKQ